MIAGAPARERVRLPAHRLAILHTSRGSWAAKSPLGRAFAVGAEQLLGELLGHRLLPHYPDLARSRVELDLRRLEPGEADATLAGLRVRGPDAELEAPHPPTTADGAPLVLDAGFWDHLPPGLDDGERHVRAEIARHLDAVPHGALVVDPGCSSGATLASIRRARPDLVQVGLDRSPAMVASALRRPELAGAEIRIHDSRLTLPVRARLCVCRCVGHRVVSRPDADAILDRCVAALEPGGTLIVAGFTALHHRRRDLVARGLQVRQSVAFDAEGRLFPFYRAARP